MDFILIQFKKYFWLIIMKFTIDKDWTADIMPTLGLRHVHVYALYMTLVYIYKYSIICSQIWGEEHREIIILFWMFHCFAFNKTFTVGCWYLQLWIQRLTAALQEHDMEYVPFMSVLAEVILQLIHSAIHTHLQIIDY